ncbi:MAG: 4-hydroxy-tetrahydrodipicolinate reductase [Verrucomicrobiota bacterium]
MLPLLVTGASGRMGQAIRACAEGDPAVEVVATHHEGQSLAEAFSALSASSKGPPAVIDFTHHSFTAQVLEQAVAAHCLLVLGTTGHTGEERAAIHQAAQRIPIAFAPNFSVGVNTLFWLTRKATEILGDDFDLEVVEMHHKHKVDSPSGTARRLGEILAEVSGVSYENDVQHGRHGDIGPRSQKEIGMHAVRGGDVVGDHTVIYAGDGERVELTHKAASRQTFANGSLRAAKWLIGQDPGLYDMQDVLGLH